jgi:hypothetical protein
MLAASLPVIVWAAHFAVIYGFTTLACAREMAVAVPWVVGAASLAALIVLGAIAVPAGMRAARTHQLPDFLAVGLGGLAVIAVVWEGSSPLWISACA